MLNKVIHKQIVLFFIGFLTSVVLSEQAFCQNKKALLVGISNYPTSGNPAWNNIHGTNDVSIISTTLTQMGFSVTMLCDRKATSANIIKGLSTLATRSSSGDTIYIHFSCHGQPFEDADGDEEDGWDESIVPYDACMNYTKGVYEGDNHITDDVLSTYISGIRKSVGPTGFVCVVIDACHAGGSSRGEENEEESFCRGTKSGFTPNGKSYRPRINAQGFFKIKKEKGLSNIIILEACRSYQSNYEIFQDGKYYGPLSYYVNKSFIKGFYISNTDWIDQIKKMMEKDTRLTRQNMVYESSF